MMMTMIPTHNCHNESLRWSPCPPSPPKMLIQSCAPQVGKTHQKMAENNIRTFHVLPTAFLPGSLCLTGTTIQQQNMEWEGTLWGEDS